MYKPGFKLGALVGLLLTAPLVVVSALANQLAGLPFVPFDLFPFIRDNTPGGIMTAVIDVMVDTLIALNVQRVDQAAKTVEQGMAMLMLIGVGVVAAGVYFVAMRRMAVTSWFASGLGIGLIVGLPLALISNQLGLSSRSGSPTLDAVWIIVLFVIWGLAVVWAYARLSAMRDPAPAASAPVSSRIG